MLSKDGWVYLLNTRQTSVTINNTENARYAMATINSDGTPVKGLIIFPDDFDAVETEGVTWSTINNMSNSPLPSPAPLGRHWKKRAALSCRLTACVPQALNQERS